MNRGTIVTLNSPLETGTGGPGSHVDAAYPRKLEAVEAALIDQRRSTLPVRRGPSSRDPDRLPGDAIGLGLSGGGIRSATFSLGILQALAQVGRLRDIDFLSTVSGGGYIGAFLGRLFTRHWIRNPVDVERVLLSEDPAGAPPGLGERAIRWLRENGRYLAPKGSGDLLLLASIALRNWVAVQVVLVTFVLTLFVFLQIARGGLDWVTRSLSIATPLANFLVCTLPAGNSLLLWSPWLVIGVGVFAVWVVPTGWAYFLVSHDRTGRSGLHPMWGAALILVASGAGVIQYIQGAQPARLAFAGGFAALAALALIWLAAAKWRARRKAEAEATGVTRNVVSRWLTTGLTVTVALLAWALLDTMAATLYAVWADSSASVGSWFSAVFAALAGIAAFARQIAMLVGAKRDGSRPTPTFSVITWVAAAGVVSVWLISIAAASYAVVWRLQPLPGKPPAIGAAHTPTLLGTERIIVTPDQETFVVTPAPAAEPASCPATGAAPEGTGVVAVAQPAWPYVWIAFVALFLVSVTFGHTRTFANMSSLHAFYAARLTRTYLGASNLTRHGQQVPVTETIQDDDLDAHRYSRWPFFGAARENDAEPVHPWMRGGPLHFINVTVNETLDSVTGVQHTDRKGTGLAFGPAGFSLGIRHHLVVTNSPIEVYPKPSLDGLDKKPYCAFSLEGTTPEPLPLGRWVSISGAAFSAAAGAQTNVPMALLAGMFNVRLGYWWDSGTPWLYRSWFAKVFPVQQALLSEAFARTRGTADRLWNLSDGGHFENMGGYELIRRRLPLIVIIDGEADPDYYFEGLSDLVRKARLDFNAEITFLTGQQLSEMIPGLDGASRVPVVPASVRPYFGDLDALRRGRWSDEPLPPSGDEDTEKKRYTIEVNRSRVSRAHAALARVHYLDSGDASWLVYVKATLMGDEPADVCQYHRAHPEFPQEPTTDQFFDEAQWESYRRLGLHVGHRVLSPELFDHLRDYPAPRG